MKKLIVPICLTMFDGGASGAAAAGASGSGEGGTNGSPDSTQQGNSGGQQKIVLGKQPPQKDTGKAEGIKEDGSSDAGSAEDRNAGFQKMITGEYKDLYDAEINRIIGKRFKETKGIQESLDAQKPIIDQLSRKYGIQNGDMNALRSAIESDDDMWSRAAEEAGMSVDQYRQVQRLQSENDQLRAQQNNLWAQQRSQQQVQGWLRQAQAMNGDPRFEGFDLAREIQEDPKFLELLKVGIPVEAAYSALHLQDVTARASTVAAKQTEKAVTANIRARGTRPVENGASSQAGVIYKSDPSKWTDAELTEAIKRVKRGGKMYL